ncbi:hypothetical protein [Streptacidiphilus pinicola]|uniref:hypothetical protein n=1 Tax=Streptacidiphilus pinicola TaxID=2219663 RepID=UPI001057CD25|nr:hypothetical protein [Streptacidiphilus pinicola]
MSNSVERAACHLARKKLYRMIYFTLARMHLISNIAIVGQHIRRRPVIPGVVVLARSMSAAASAAALVLLQPCLAVAAAGSGGAVGSHRGVSDRPQSVKVVADKDGLHRTHLPLRSGHGRGRLTTHRSPAAATRGADPDTTTTFSVTSGALSMSAPVSASLGSGAPGTTVSGALGAVSVTDDRALLSASWTATASVTDFTTGGGTPPETIPATDSGYDPGAITTTGTITATGTVVTLSNSPQTVVTGTSGVGDNTASWDPNVSIALPASAVGGTYTGTLTQSVA